jgi:DUF4097 and DUF4098 domain-containing protein YvlB
MKADTGSGSVRIEVSRPGSIDVNTGSGSVRVRGAEGRVRVDTGSGSIEVTGNPTEPWTLDTGSGSVTVRLPREASFELNARTSSGSINTDRPITVQGSIGRRELRGTAGQGGVLLTLSTGSGSINIH